MSREAVIVDTVRTPIGKRKGALAGWHPTDLLAFTLQELLRRTEVEPERIDDVIGGCVTQVGEQGCNVTRNAWVAAGLPQSVSATSVDRQCGSSQQAVHFAAQGVIAGGYDLAIALRRRVDDSRAPMASNASGGMGPFSPAFLDACNGQLMTQFEVAQILADKFGISRAEMDEYAVRSHQRADESTKNGFFAREIVPVPIKDAESNETGEMLTADEGIRPESTVEKLGALQSAANWDPDLAPSITAGNASQMSDGAAAMLVAERSTAEALGLPIRARINHMVVGADDAVLVLSRAEPGHSEAARSQRARHRRLRCHRMQRGVRRDRADVEQGVPARPRSLQRPRGSHRHRPSARRQRCPHHGNPPEPAGNDRRSPRLPDHV